MTCTCLERLERAVASHEKKYRFVTLADIRAALKEAGPAAVPEARETVPRVHVQAPFDWKSQMWQVVQDDGGLFCLTFHADSASGGRAREIAELIARAVNALAAAPRQEK